MTRRLILPAIIFLGCEFIQMDVAVAQRGGQEWLTSNADAQRSSWI